MKHLKVSVLELNPIVSPELVEADGKPCPYCSQIMDKTSVFMKPTRDHLYARKHVRRSSDKRVVIVCSQCNFLKGEKTLQEFLTEIVVKNLELKRIVSVNENRIAHLNYLLKTGLT